MTVDRDHPSWKDWRWQVLNRISSPEECAEFISRFARPEGAPEPNRATARSAHFGDGTVEAAERYPMAVTPYYLSLARSLSSSDPIIAMSLTDPRELLSAGNRPADFTGEGGQCPVPGLIHRYPDRALLLVSSACPVHCRHCMRQRLLTTEKITGEGATGGADMTSGEQTSGSVEKLLEGWIEYLEQSPGIREVILSGGDPLMLGTDVLDRILTGIRSVGSVEIIRVGTRVPVTLPMRVTAELCRMFEKHHPLWMVTQFNHPVELTAEAASAADRLLAGGIPLENQSVLLRGVNDDADILTELCRGLGALRIRPLYLHQCDPASGVEHFRAPLRRGMELIRVLEKRLGGTTLPRFMVDLPGGRGKLQLTADRIFARAPGEAILIDPHGRAVPYPDAELDAGPDGAPLR